MIFFATSGRCAVELSLLEQLPLPQHQIRAYLELRGFRVCDVDWLTLARECVSSSVYRLGARTAEAPQTVDCSTLAQYLYAMRGIAIPRLSVSQRRCAMLQVSLEEIALGDLVFATGVRGSIKRDNPDDAVGHVAFATGEGTVIQADGFRSRVVEVPIDRMFDERRQFRGAYRYIISPESVLTLEVPSEVDVVTSDDVYGHLFRQLPKRP